MNTTKQIALERIGILFRLSRQVVNENPERAQRYVDIARRLSMTARVRLPVEYRRQVCRHCKRFILPGINCRVRIQQRREPHVVVTCLQCGGHMRFPLRNKKKGEAL
ncbi:MAG TPA: ribonuclease P [Candidatus Bathyarchaeia archaeon]|nr:ribonuclease P [Candidatus Bathyarchaeia archaeon]